jgi:MFS family permease
LGRRAAFVLVAYLFIVTMLGGTIPTTLYPIYQRQIGFSSLVVTLVFAAYAAGTLGALLLLGQLSDQIGRRRVLLAVLGLATISSVVFIFAQGLTGLFVARFLSGLSTGLGTGTATATLTDLVAGGAATRAALVAGMVNLTGLSLGPLLSGTLAQWAPAPTVLPYVAFLVLLVPGLGVLAAPETVKVRKEKVSIRLQRLSVPREIRGPFTAAAAAGFAAFALFGLWSALVSSFLAESLHNHSHALAGLMAFALFAAAAAAQPVASQFARKTSIFIGLSLLIVGLVLITIALPTASLTVFVAGAVIGGVGAGLAFKTGVTLVTQLAPDDQRSEVLSSFFVAAYIGTTVPVIGVGVLISLSSLFVATVVFSSVVAAIAVAAAFTGFRHAPTTPEP